MTPDFIVSEARRWIGTPYVHQAACKGAGADCLGLVIGLWRGFYGQAPVKVPAYTPDWSEAARDEQLLTAASRFLREIGPEAARSGDVVVFRMREGAVAKHLGILAIPAPDPTFIHAYSGHGVVESPLSAPWQRRIAAYFRFPERG